jgi:hypothetical protein
MLISGTTGGNGSVPRGICHCSVASEDIRLWNRFSESGQIKAKSSSEATPWTPEFCADWASSQDWQVASVEAGPAVDTLLVSHEDIDAIEACCVGRGTDDGSCFP